MSKQINSSHYNALCSNVLHTDVMSDEFFKKNVFSFMCFGIIYLAGGKKNKTIMPVTK